MVFVTFCGAPKGSKISVLNGVCCVWWNSKILQNVTFDCSEMSVLNGVCHVGWGSKRVVAEFAFTVHNLHLFCTELWFFGTIPTEDL